MIISALLAGFSFRLQGFQGLMREDGPVEWASCIFELLGAYCCIQIILLSRKNGLKRPLWLIAALGVLFFFAGAEEISWGQRIVGWVPMSGAQSGNLQREFNFHNLRALKGPFVVGTAFALFFIFSAILPVLIYRFKSLKRFWIKTGMPLVSPTVCLSLWMGFIFLVFLRHFKTGEGGALVFLWDVDVSLQEWREFYFPMTFFVYVFTEYYSLLRCGAPYDFDRPKVATLAPYNPLLRVWDDILYIIFQNKALVLVILLYLFIGSPLLKERLVRQTVSDLDLVLSDPRISVVQGESPQAHNAKTYWFSRDPKYFGGKCLYMMSPSLPDEGYFSFRYTFSIEKDGSYKLFVGSSPPGPLGVGRDPNKQFTPYAYSPYTVLVDDSVSIDVYQEKKDNELRKSFKKGNFYSYYNYAPAMAFTKLGVLELKKGTHTVEFKVHKMQPYSKEYVFGLDAVFVVPQNWKLDGKFKTLPDDIFSY